VGDIFNVCVHSVRFIPVVLLSPTVVLLLSNRFFSGRSFVVANGRSFVVKSVFFGRSFAVTLYKKMKVVGDIFDVCAILFAVLCSRGAVYFLTW